MMRIRIAAAMAGVCLLSTASSVVADPMEDALDLLTRDAPAGLAALETLAAGGDVEAMNAVAGIIYDAPAESRLQADPARAVALWERAVAGGSMAARANYGTRLLLNDDDSDDARAVAMLREVDDERIIPAASYGLGRAYLFGDGVEQDLERGSRLLILAVEAHPENMDAQFLVGRAYRNGWGIPVDARAAFRHLKLAADAGDGRAQWNLGMMLLNGEGVGADEAAARRYVAAAAESGNLDGMISMAVMLALGEGGAADPEQARAWYERAARQGSAHALRGLAGMLLNGEGGPADPVAGAAYLDLAAKAGDAYALRMQAAYADRIAALNSGRIETVKAEWLRAYGMPR